MAQPKPKIATGDMDTAFAEMRAQAKAGKDAVAFASDPNFYTCLVFDTAEQRDYFIEFLRAFGERAGVDIQGARYLDGIAIAKMFGLEDFPASPAKLTSPFKSSGTLSKFAMDFDDLAAIEVSNEFAPVEFDGTDAPEDDPLASLDDALADF